MFTANDRHGSVSDTRNDLSAERQVNKCGNDSTSLIILVSGLKTLLKFMLFNQIFAI